MALNLKTFGTRALSAFFFVIILVAGIYFDYLSFLILFFIVAVIAQFEYYRLAQKLHAQPYKLIGYLSGVLVFLYFSCVGLSFYFKTDLSDLMNVTGALLMLIPSLLLLKALFSQSGDVLSNVQHTILGVLYPVFPFALLISFPFTWDGNQFQYVYFKVLGIIFLIWSNDTLAYLGGSIFGKNKMYERISPGKTWEGTITGAVGAIVVGFLLNLNNTYNSQLIWPSIALLVAIFGTIGDLVESMLKRLAGVKDSGQIMPGHGGALDRFDSLIFVTPFVYVFLRLAGYC